MVNKSMNSYFKSPMTKSRSFFLHPLCWALIGEMAFWAEDNKLPFSITETVTTPSEDKALNRVSTSHREGRAFDISSRGWPQPKIDQFIALFCSRYQSIAAWSSTDNQPKLVVYHDAGNGFHFHVQISKIFAVNNLIQQGE